MIKWFAKRAPWTAIQRYAKSKLVLSAILFAVLALLGGDPFRVFLIGQSDAAGAWSMFIGAASGFVEHSLVRLLFAFLALLFFGLGASAVVEADRNRCSEMATATLEREAADWEARTRLVGELQHLIDSALAEIAARTERIQAQVTLSSEAAEIGHRLSMTSFPLHEAQERFSKYSAAVQEARESGDLANNATSRRLAFEAHEVRDALLRGFRALSEDPQIMLGDGTNHEHNTQKLQAQITNLRKRVETIRSEQMAALQTLGCTRTKLASGKQE